MMPGEDGLSVCRRLRGAERQHPDHHADRARATTSTASSAWKSAPTITCPSRSTRASWSRASTRCCGGAPRPSRRARPRPSAGQIEFGAVQRSTSPRAASRATAPPSPLTTGEFALLKVLVQHPRMPLSRDKLMELARGREYEVFDRSIDVQISRLRKLVETDPAHPAHIQTVWGFGYVFVPDGKGGSASVSAGSLAPHASHLLARLRCFPHPARSRAADRWLGAHFAWLADLRAATSASRARGSSRSRSRAWSTSRAPR